MINPLLGFDASIISTKLIPSIEPQHNHEEGAQLILSFSKEI